MRSIAFVCLFALAASAGEGPRLGDLQEELRGITAAMHGEARLLDSQAACGRELERALTWERILDLEVARQAALRRLAGAGAKPSPLFASAMPPESFARLLAREDWAAADPPRSEQGLFEAVHVPTGLVFALIPGGSYVMGREYEDDDATRTTLPPRRVEVASFLLSKTECTQAAWRAGGGRVPIEITPGDRLPITNFSMFGFRSWAEKLGLRLPTEEEWEYASRAGSRNLWCYGDEPERLDAFAWYRGSSGGRMREVATLLPNAWGLYDMHGNASEFVGRPEDKVGRVYRGGDFNTTARGVRCAYRFLGYRGGYLVRESRSLGFRPAASLPGPPGDDTAEDR